MSRPDRGCVLSISAFVVVLALAAVAITVAERQRANVAERASTETTEVRKPMPVDVALKIQGWFTTPIPEPAIVQTTGHNWVLWAMPKYPGTLANDKLGEVLLYLREYWGTSTIKLNFSDQVTSSGETYTQVMITCPTFERP